MVGDTITWISMSLEWWVPLLLGFWCPGSGGWHYYLDFDVLGVVGDIITWILMSWEWQWHSICIQYDSTCRCGETAWLIDDHLYSAILRSLEQTHCACLWFYMRDKLFIARFFEYPPKWCTYSAGMAGATWNCSHLGASSVYTIQPCHFMQSHIRKVYGCLAVTCHLHFWQNDRDLLCATAVTQGWNGYRH